MLLNGKRIIITGGLTGIGRATVIACVENGATVASVSRQAPDADEVRDFVTATNAIGSGSVKHYQLDVTRQSDVNDVINQIAQHMGGLDGIVNSAGLVATKAAVDLTGPDMQNEMSVNLMGTAFACIASYRHMKGKGGSIVNFTSVAGLVGVQQNASYSASKAAILGFSRSLAREWGSNKVRVNIVSPAVKTELVEGWLASLTEDRLAEAYAWYDSTIPLGGALGSPEDAANLNVFLLSDMASFIHGQTIGVDGGMTMTR